ncbi:putative hydroxypyruvate reductase [Trichinella spiralis]|uniref:putative hydroxypyruvate reductase n=1 Tax=Trichinella spiralis TaxID=6334 RepID=UPI0001EFCC20|nr:putative hydroxypyruvate reductase [Trichinella spiralis]
MNTLRRCLSLVKGGGLLKMAYPASVISLIISDVVNSDLEVIASGPTVPVSRNYEQVWNIIQRVRRNNKMPDDSIAKFLKSNIDVHESDVPRYRNVSNIIIGDNAKALNGLSEKAKQFGFTPIILTSELRKQTSMFGSFLAELVLRIFDSYRDNYCCDLFETYGITSGTFQNIKDLTAKKPVCLLWGGETTPCVRGKGKGGRNMETILYFIKAVQTQMASTYMESLMSKQCVIASLGTDGQDGPTDAAGAMVSLNQLNLFDKSEVDKALLENDSYNYFQSVQNGDCLVKTGPTGTNYVRVYILITALCLPLYCRDASQQTEYILTPHDCVIATHVVCLMCQSHWQKELKPTNSNATHLTSISIAEQMVKHDVEQSHISEQGQ